MWEGRGGGGDLIYLEGHRLERKISAESLL